MINTAKEAYVELMKNVKNLDAIRCVEYEDVYVFAVAPLGFIVTDKTRLLNALYKVDKNTGKVSIFQPFKMPTEKYLSGVEIEDFK